MAVDSAPAAWVGMPCHSAELKLLKLQGIFEYGPLASLTPLFCTGDLERCYDRLYLGPLLPGLLSVPERGYEPQFFFFLCVCVCVWGGSAQRHSD